jgi:hypothetical protein
VSIRLVTMLCTMVIATGLAGVGTGQAQPAGIAGKYSGRYQCGDWNTVDLVIAEEGAGKLSAEFAFPLPRGGGVSAFSLTGQYDEHSRTFQLVPQRWTRRAPPGTQMVGMQGLFDPISKRLTGKVAHFTCRGFELVGEGGTPLPPLAQASPVTPGQAANPALQVAPGVQGIEYWDASMAAAGTGARTARESEPIDDVIDWLKNAKYSCVGTQRATWNAEGTRASTTRDRVDTRETYVIECDGDCRGLRYMPMTDAVIQHSGQMRPVPVLYMRNMRGGGTPLHWIFTRPPGGEPPEIYVHHWNAHSFNRGAAGCRAPKASSR